MWIGAPVAEVDAGSGLAAADDEGLHQTARVSICTFKVVAGCPGIGIVGSIREQDVIARGLLGDRELDHLTGGHIFKIQRQWRIELARIREAACDRSMRQVFRADYRKLPE